MEELFNIKKLGKDIGDAVKIDVGLDLGSEPEKKEKAKPKPDESLGGGFDLKLDFGLGSKPEKKEPAKPEEASKEEPVEVVDLAPEGEE